MRFFSKHDAVYAKGKLDGIIIRGSTLEVKDAKYGRQDGGAHRRNENRQSILVNPNHGIQHRGFLNGRSFKELVMENDQDKRKMEMENRQKNSTYRRVMQKNEEKEDGKTIVVYGEVDELMPEKMSRSINCWGDNVPSK